MSGILATLRSAGGAAIFATLDQETIPAAPSAVAGDAINATSATLTLVDNSGNETGFEWQLETPPGAGNWAAATGATNPTAPGVTSFIATGLTGATDYGVRARARGVTFNSAYVTGAAFGTDNVAGGGGIIPPPGTAPIVSTHPVAQMVTAGSAALFSVVASGTAPLTYQWRFIGANIAGATLSTYSRQTSLGDDGGTVSVVVTNSFGSVTSNNAALTVGLAPFVTVPPSAQSVNETSSVTFAVAYAGTVPVVVQWLRNGVAIVGQAGNSYTFTPQLTDSGATFSARLTNAYGTATSSAAAGSSANADPSRGATSRPLWK